MRKKKLDESEPVEAKDIADAIDVLLDDELALKDNVCAKKHCGAGKECRVNENGVAECVCIHTCPQEKDPRRMVLTFLKIPCATFSLFDTLQICSNHNETWNSDCELYRMRCLCKSGSSECVDAKYDHAHVEYFGTCRDVPVS